MSKVVRVALPQLALFESDPLPAALPTRAQKEPPKRECPECGRPTKALSGYLCAKCLVRRPLSVEARARVCCTTWGRRQAKCPEGECLAIPF